MRQEDWRSRADRHRERARPWIEARLARRAAGTTHAVDDFLFDYYPFSPAKLSSWHPGLGEVLEGPEAEAYLAHPGYIRCDGGVTADIAWLTGRGPRLDLAIRLLTGTRSRPAQLGCFGLHEWAMVYRLDQEDVRHSYLPLRLGREEIAATVDTIGLRCSHIDAYRFFTPDAAPLNSLRPTRATQPDLEQPGCLHAAMDLYKVAGWFSPLVGSDLLMDCFENAARARRLDMRASPYDVTGFGLQPVRVETAAGRREYVRAQADLVGDTDLLRSRLIDALEALRMAFGGQAESFAHGRP